MISMRWICLFSLGLVCALGVGYGGCVPEGPAPDGGVASDGGSSPEGGSPTERREPPSTDIAPLPASSFVYVHFPRASVGHIYSYDTATQKATLISKLDDDGSKGTETPLIALSPDRKWIAMRALFRPNAGDLATKLPTPSLWLISVDGKQHRRVTEPIPNPNLKSGKCSVNSQCSTNYCNVAGGYCSYRNYKLGLSLPRWSHDSKSLWTAFSTHWSEGTRLTGGAVPASAPVSGGLVEPHAVASGCAQVTNIAPHPKKAQFAAVHTVCSGGKPGIHLYDMPPKSGTQPFPNAQIDAQIADPSWSPDGQILYFLASTQWDLNDDGKPDSQGIGIVGYDFQKKQLGGVLPPLKEGLSYSSFSIDPTGSKMVLCIFDSKANQSKLVLFDSKDSKEPLKNLLENQKNNCNPSWF